MSKVIEFRIDVDGGEQMTVGYNHVKTVIAKTISLPETAEQVRLIVEDLVSRAFAKGQNYLSIGLDEQGRMTAIECRVYQV
jgi:hypothetical protein